MNIASWEFEYVERFGSQIGLIADGRSWTNAELLDRSCRLAHALIDGGLQPGDRVAISLPNCIELFIATSAVWIAGGVVVVMAEPPQSVLEGMIAHCSASVLVTRSRTQIRLDSLRSQIVVRASGALEDGLLHIEDLIRSHEPWLTPIARRGADVAQLCYTSGATGLPKAAIYTHAGTEAFWSAARVFGKGAVVTTAVLAIPSTAFGARFIGMRLATNTQYVLLTDSKPASILAAVSAYGASEVSLVPTIAEQLTADGAFADYDMSSLRAIHLGGAHVSSQLVQRLKERFSTPSQNVAVWVHYGMTEAGGGITRTANGGDGLVGKILSGLETRVVDQQGNDVQPTQTGEILVRSPFAAAGYWNDDKNTAEVFRQGFVHTGDLGRFDEHGDLWVVGRLKDVIIQGGYNVVPNEVIGAISAVQGVAACAVVGVPNDLMGEEVVACVVRAPGARLDEQTIRAHCRNTLDLRKQPTRILFFEDLPLTHNAKLDARSLKARIASMQASLARSPFRLRLDALNPPQRIALIAEIVEALLPTVLPGADAERGVKSDVPFGAMGLESIGVVRMAHALTERLGATISPTLFYSSPTVSALAARIQTKVWGRASSARSGDEVPVPHTKSAGQIAITGIGCRLPGGAKSPEQLWDMLLRGVDATCEAPEARFAPDAARTRAAFLPHAGDFDGQFFRLASQAEDLDPRHRMVLEVAWEALEDAGCDPTRLDPRRTGVFLGMYGSRYRSRDPLAAAPSMAAAYLCQFLNLRGPVMTVDTTCSSSLVAVHSAVMSLKSGECDTAIVGGANWLSDSAHRNPLGVIAPDGRSKAFDASADGFGQGEGCVLLVLRRLEDAVTSEDRIYAIVRGTAINHDGRSSSLTAPNAQAQEEVIRTALAAAGEQVGSVQYVEAHGTGTLLGDPIEVEGLTRVFGERSGPALRIGSLKTNIGHLEAAAGVAGLAKVALAIANRRLPPSLHFSVPNPHIPWAEIPVRVQTQASVWPEPTATLTAGVSSFGMSGTNAHAVVSEEPPRDSGRWAEADRLASSEGPWVLPLSAASAGALRTRATEWAEALARLSPETTCRDVAFTASCGRAALSHRLAVVGRTRDEWSAKLRQYASDEGAFGSYVERPRPNLVMVFSGQGTQWWGMGRELLQAEPVFREAVTACAQQIDRHMPWSALEELARDEGSSNVDDSEFAQPLLFALQVGVLELWRSWGVEPSAVVGHSLGEITAAYAAGVLTLEQAAQIVCTRARLFGPARDQGGMAAFSVTIEEAEELCRAANGALEVAAINAPRSITLSGDFDALDEARARAKTRGVACQRLRTCAPFHSRHFEAVATQLTAALDGLVPQAPRIPLASTLTGTLSPPMNAAYWGRQCRAPVRFEDSIHALLQNGASIFLEVGAHPALFGAIQSIATSSGVGDAVVVGGLRRGVSDSEAMANALGQLYSAGYPVEWTKRYAVRGRRVSLPRYPWDHEPAKRVVAPASIASVPATRSAARLSHTRESLRELIRTQIASELQLPVDRVLAHRSFDSLGLDSLATIRLRSSLSVSLAITVPVVRLDSTLDALVEQLHSAALEAPSLGANDASPLVWLRSTGSAPTVVWIHPVGGGIDCYRTIARLSAFRSVAVESPALSSEAYSPSSLAQMAQHYLQFLQSGVKGPLILAGWSLGGLLALEMAEQLRLRGRAVSNVILIDCYPPSETLAQTLGMIGPEGGDAVTKYFMRDFMLRTEGGADSRVALDAGAAALPGITAEETARLQRAFRINIEAARGYRPPVYKGRVLLIQAASSDVVPDAEKAALWAGLLPSLEVRPVTGDHYSLLREPAAEKLVKSLSEFVQPATRARAASSALI